MESSNIFGHSSGVWFTEYLAKSIKYMASYSAVNSKYSNSWQLPSSFLDESKNIKRMAALLSFLLESIDQWS